MASDELASIMAELRARRAAEEAHRRDAASMEAMARSHSEGFRPHLLPRSDGQYDSRDFHQAHIDALASLLAQVRAQAMAECAAIAAKWQADFGGRDDVTLSAAAQTIRLAIAAAIRAKAGEG